MSNAWASAFNCLLYIRACDLASVTLKIVEIAHGLCRLPIQCRNLKVTVLDHRPEVSPRQRRPVRVWLSLPCEIRDTRTPKIPVLHFMAPVQQLGVLDVVCYIGISWLIVRLFTSATSRWTSIQITPLRGPRSKSIFGMSREVDRAEDAALIYEKWLNEYGPAYKIPRSFGSYNIVIMDPKANAHFYAMPDCYVQTKSTKIFVESFVSKLCDPLACFFERVCRKDRARFALG